MKSHCHHRPKLPCSTVWAKFRSVKHAGIALNRKLLEVIDESPTLVKIPPPNVPFTPTAPLLFCWIHPRGYHFPPLLYNDLVVQNHQLYLYPNLNQVPVYQWHLVQQSLRWGSPSPIISRNNTSNNCYTVPAYSKIIGVPIVNVKLL